jgi:hypothetical protein
MKLTRIVLITALAAIFMPSPPPDDPLRLAAGGESHVAARRAAPAELAYAAMAAASDAGSFCLRQPQACDIAGRFWSDFTLRLRYTLRLGYQWATGRKDTPSPAGMPARALPEDNSRNQSSGTARFQAARPAPPAAGMRPGDTRPRPLVVPASGDHGPLRAGAGSPHLSAPSGAGRKEEGADPLITGSTRIPGTKAPALRLAERRSQETPQGAENTLTIEDLLIPWNGPRQG